MGDKLKPGILDLLTILVPGGFLLIFIRPYLQGYIEIIAGSFPTLSTKDPVLYAGFIAIAYILGGFIYFIASYLDDWIYANVSKVFWPNPALTAYIIEFKARQTGIPGRKVINAFKWSCGWLLKHHQPMYDEVERVMAESKFFRSMVLVQRIASTGKIYLSDSVCGYEEYWYKWTLNDAAGKALAANLEQNHYRQIVVTKTRRALKLTIDPANVLIMIHAVHEDLREGFQVEYTTVTMSDGQENETWYSFAIESFGNSLPGLSPLQGLALLSQVQMRPEDSCAYPEFLARNFIN